MKKNFKRILKLLYSIALTVAIFFSITGCQDSQATSNKTSAEEIKTEEVKTDNITNTVEVKEDTTTEPPKSKEKEKTVCIACHGTGEVEQYYTNDPLEEPHWETCALCKGKGYYYE